MTTRERRPSLLLAVWAALVVLFFVLRGDLRIAGTNAMPGSAPGAAPDAASVPTSAPPAPGPVVVRAERAPRRAAATHTCKGRVVDALGFLVVGAEVQSTAGSSRTDADGRFQLDAAQGQALDVLVRSKGLQSRRLRVWPVSPDPLVLQLLPAAPWDGEPAPLPAPGELIGEGLARTDQGAPLTFAWVTAIGSGAWSRTDEIGRYSLPLPSPQVTVLVHQPNDIGGVNGLAGRSEPIDVGRAQGVVPLPEITARPAGTIRGVVRDPRGTPIEGVPVRVRGEGIARVFETGPGGRFRLAGLQAGRYVVRPFAFRGALGAPHEVVLDGPVVDCDLHLQSAEERRLRLLDERGEPLGRAYVATAFAGERNSVAQTDAAGWTAVVMCDEQPAAVEFEVRTGPDHEPAPVRHYDADRSTLVVGLQ